MTSKPQGFNKFQRHSNYFYFLNGLVGDSIVTVKYLFQVGNTTPPSSYIRALLRFLQLTACPKKTETRAYLLTLAPCEFSFQTYTV